MPSQNKYPGVYVEEVPSGAYPIAGVPTAIAAFVDVFASGPVNAPVTVSSFTDFEQQFGGLNAASEASYAVQQFFANGGTQAAVVRVDDAEGLAKGILGDETAKTGLYALAGVDLFNILCVPATMKLPEADAGAVAAAAGPLCSARKAMYLVDPPLDGAPDSMAGITQWLGKNASLRSADAALYFPRTVMADPLANGEPRTIAASGSVAGVWARTDAARGVWKAPAGQEATIAGIEDLAVRLSDAENGILNPLAVNSLREFPGAGPVVWGARTLAGDDATGGEWRYVSVRRLMFFIAESVCRGTTWAGFLPNSGPLWAQIRVNVGAFLHALFLQGAFAGPTPKQAYFVRCDETINPPSEEGTVAIEIGFAPLKPAEFVIVQIRQLAAGT